jgi:alkylation response protein AidB-like acyl-CoA dehydrogenase
MLAIRYQVSTEQKKKYLPGLCDGRLIGANGASEPEAGSDIFSMQTRVRKACGEYALKGRKIFVTNAPVADLFTIYATLDPQLGATGICAFIVEKGTPGLSVGKKKDKLGLRTALMAELLLEDCHLPGTALLGREGRGVEVFNCSMAGSEPVSWRPVSERCGANSNVASNTHGGASNSASPSASSSQWRTALLI